jgi:hypothetical protein
LLLVPVVGTAANPAVNEPHLLKRSIEKGTKWTLGRGSAVTGKTLLALEAVSEEGEDSDSGVLQYQKDSAILSSA